MGSFRSTVLLYFCFISFFSLSQFCYAADTIAPGQSISGNETLISSDDKFLLGFFSPQNSQKRYLGMWYKKDRLLAVVWVANRETPVTDSSGVLKIGADGNLVVLDGQKKTLWSTNSPISSSYSTAKLWDSGNLVLSDGNSGNVLWQSFDYPSDTLLPGMKLRQGQLLRSWKSTDDPSPGAYTLGLDPKGSMQFIIWRRSVPYWQSGLWDGEAFAEAPDIRRNSVYNYSFDKENQGETYFTHTVSNASVISRFLLGIVGQMMQVEWLDPAQTYILLWSRPKSECDVFGACGPNGVCNRDNSPVCKCVPGFEPESAKDWGALNDWSGGCVRKIQLQCGQRDRFLRLTGIRLPEQQSPVDGNVQDCEAECLGTCQCKAYAYVNNVTTSGRNSSRCLIWGGDLTGLRENYDGGQDILIRLGASELETQGRHCGYCGTNLVPYPLQTRPDCGDPSYRIICNTSTGQLRFPMVDGSSCPITAINTETMTFVILPPSLNSGLCSAAGFQNDLQLNQSLNFYVSPNNSILFLNCSTRLSSSKSNCSPALCKSYTQRLHYQSYLCWAPFTCCSHDSVGSSILHSIEVDGTGCSAVTGVLNLSTKGSGWVEGVEIGWVSPPEPMCNSQAECNVLSNSTCRPNPTRSGQRRCLCNNGFQWDPINGSCTHDVASNRFLGGSQDKKRQLIVALTVPVFVGLLIFGTIIYCLWRRKANQKEIREKDLNTILFDTATDVPGAMDMSNENNSIIGEKKGPQFWFFHVGVIAAATNNFLHANKLGEGGFGPVYKGKLPDGQEIAVKRLSRSSGQGLEEFKNEVSLIAKLQHRNLVRLLGYCIQEEEKMLVYEYMPNKSLDCFLFDQTRCTLLDWGKRFNIILGISRGLLYLHHDSRLRIIHRDLKASNILLDEEMNPKISDFGMARIFANNQTEGNTNRVVGTYGYMSPEYALDGLFSVKSDVYSFGVLLLEIISGRKNSGFYNLEHSLNLLGYAWRLWNADRGLELMDPSLYGSSYKHEVLRCINVALLCVQEDAGDRPTMSSIVVMLSSDAMTLATPKEPAFYLRNFNEKSYSSSGPRTCSINEVTVSMVEAR